MAQCQKYSKTADEVEKKVTTFGENIRPGQCQPYEYMAMALVGAKENVYLFLTQMFEITFFSV